MIQLNCKTPVWRRHLRKACLSVQNIIFSSLCNTHNGPLPFKVRKRLPGMCCFEEELDAGDISGGQKEFLDSLWSKSTLVASTTPARRQGVQAVLALQLQSHPSARQKVCCTEKFHRSTDLKYTLPICVTVQILLIFTVKTYYTPAQAWLLLCLSSYELKF